MRRTDELHRVGFHASVLCTKSGDPPPFCPSISVGYYITLNYIYIPPGSVH